MSDIFNEISDEVRRDKLAQVWKRHGRLIIALVVLGVAALAGWQFYQYRQNVEAQVAAQRFDVALRLAREGNQDEAQAAFTALAQEAGGPYQTLARLRAAAQIGQGDAEAGAAAFDAIANDASLDMQTREFATLRAVMLRFDNLEAKDVASRLEALAAPGKPWRHSARELLGLAAFKAGDYANAGKWFDQIVIDTQAPQALRSRAELYLELVRSGPVSPAS